MGGNTNLGTAKTAKKDEFYTQWNDIENEMQAYLEYDPDVFRGKTVLLPCDDPGQVTSPSTLPVSYTHLTLPTKA